MDNKILLKVHSPLSQFFIALPQFKYSRMEEVSELLTGILRDTNWHVAEAAYESDGKDDDGREEADNGVGGCCIIS